MLAHLGIRVVIRHPAIEGSLGHDLSGHAALPEPVAISAKFPYSAAIITMLPGPSASTTSELAGHDRVSATVLISRCAIETGRFETSARTLRRCTGPR